MRERLSQNNISLFVKTVVILLVVGGNDPATDSNFYQLWL